MPYNTNRNTSSTTKLIDVHNTRKLFVFGGGNSSNSFCAKCGLPYRIHICSKCSNVSSYSIFSLSRSSPDPVDNAVLFTFDTLALATIFNGMANSIWMQFSELGQVDGQCRTSTNFTFSNLHCSIGNFSAVMNLLALCANNNRNWASVSLFCFTFETLSRILMCEYSCNGIVTFALFVSFWIGSPIDLYVNTKPSYLLDWLLANWYDTTMSCVSITMIFCTFFGEIGPTIVINEFASPCTEKKTTTTLFHQTLYTSIVFIIFLTCFDRHIIGKWIYVE